MPLEDADQEQSHLVNELRVSKVNIPVEGKCFVKNARLFVSAREKFLNNVKCKMFPTKNLNKILTLNLKVFDTPKPAKEKSKKSQFKLHENFINKIVNNEKKYKQQKIYGIIWVSEFFILEKRFT